MGSESGRRGPTSFEQRSTDRTIRVRGWLIVLALLPFIGAIGLAYSEIVQAQQSRTSADTVSGDIAVLVQLSDLRSELLEERLWASARAGVLAIGADDAQARTVMGLDLPELEESAARRVDAHVQSLRWSELGIEIEALRSMKDKPIDATNAEYERLSKLIEDRLASSVDELLVTIGQTGGGVETASSLRAFEAASQADHSLTLQLTGYLGTQFGGASTAAEDLASLSENTAKYDDALETLDQLATFDDGRLRGALDDLAASGDTRSFRGAVDRVIERPLMMDLEVGFDVTAIMSEIDAIRADVQAWAGAVDIHSRLVEAAAADIATQSQILDQTATDSVSSATRRIGLLVVASAIFMLGMARAIDKPLARLASAAQNLRDGTITKPMKPSGPTEVREAMLALNEAAAHIQLAERQAQVLAEGRLDDEVLNERAPGSLGRSLQEAVQTLAGSLNDREEFRRRLSHEATHDGLTQLANRKASLTQLDKSLARTARSGTTIAVMFIDLDGFKEINDNHGHPVGDAVLWTLGKRLRTALRTGDHVGRLGGDEFLVIAEPITGASEARMLAGRIGKYIGEPMEIGSLTLSVTASIGVAIADGVHDLTATELLHDADLAVYRAKELGRSRIELCDESLHRELLRRAEVEEALRAAIPAGELVMYYQPILDATTAELASLEALVRWDRPGIGMTPPDQFIPIAERSDLISEVDNWVVRHVVEQLAAWSTNPHLRGVPIAINISGRHLSSESFVEDILSPVRNAGIDPARLVLEVTESALLDDLDSAAAKLQALREQAIQVAIDDFGTGYTSLGHLRSLPIDILKIDRTFINDESAGSLVKLIIDTGHLIGARITSEGIETVDQAANLTELGSDCLQGYLFARPMPAASVQQELEATSPNHQPFLH